MEFGTKNSKIQSERENINTSRPPLDSIPIGAKTPDAKTPATDSSACKEKIRKEYLQEDPNLETDSSDSSSSNNDSSNDINDKLRRNRNKKKPRKHKKHDPIKLCAKLTAKLLEILYNWKVLKFKLEEDPLKRQIYFFTIMESLEMILHITRKLVMYLYIIQI